METPEGAPAPPESKTDESVPPRTPRKRARTPKQLERQEKAFAMHLEGKTYREIAVELKCDKETVQHDVRHELERRAEELGEMREVEKAQHLAMIGALYKTSIDMRGVPGTGALGAAAKALEMRAKILGLDAPTKVDVGLQTLLDALDG